MNVFRRVHFPIDFRVFQLLYALRILWWGVGANIFGLDFSVPFLDCLRGPFMAVGMITIGLAGLLAAVGKFYWPSYYFHVAAVVLFGFVSYSFFFHDIKSVAGANYFMEMVGVMYLTCRVQSFPFLYIFHVDSKEK